MSRIRNNEDSVVVLPSLPVQLNTINTSTEGSLSSDSRFKLLGEELAGYLMKLLLGLASPKKFKTLINFIGISRPFCELKYPKITEFQCEKQSQGRLNDGWFLRNVKSVFRRWQTRWMVLTPTHLMYYSTPEETGSTMKDSITFDADTEVVLEDCDKYSVRIVFMLSRRTLRLEVKDAVAGLIAIHYILKVFKNSTYAQIHRFESFAPERDRNDCMFFADGEGYYHELQKAVESAQDEVMITDWWFSPEVPLSRPIQASHEEEPSRIDKVLQRAAQRGVKVYVIVYKEFSMNMNNDSEHVKRALEPLHPNIKVLRHPNVIVSLWSHHEKMCIVDKFVVFMGGLDLCWGRFDYQEHPLFNDPQLRSFPGSDYYNPLKTDIVKGRDYHKSMIDPNYPRMPWHDVAVMLKGDIVKDFASHFITYWNHARETNSESEILFSKKVGSHPGSEQRVMSRAMQLSENTPDGEVEAVDPYEANPGIDMGTLQGFSNVVDFKDDSIFDPQTGMYNIINNEAVSQGGRFNPAFVQAFRSEQDKVMKITSENRRVTEAEKRIDENFENYSHIMGTSLAHVQSNPISPPLPVYTSGQSPQIQQNFGGHDLPPGFYPPQDHYGMTQDYGYGPAQGFGIGAGVNTDQGFGGFSPAPYQGQPPFENLLLSANNAEEPARVSSHQFTHDTYVQDSNVISGHIEVIHNVGSENGFEDNSGSLPAIAQLNLFNIKEDTNVGDMKMQALRSASEWSLGRRNTECSIYNSYLELIEQAEQFIFIENQFFISSTANCGVQNRIVKALFNRISKAIEQNKAFKVVVFMPLMPAFEANLEDQQGIVMHIQIGLQNQTIGKGSTSLVELLASKLQSSGINHEQYLMVCSLRKFQRRPTDGKPITELIYIHSKVAERII